MNVAVIIPALNEAGNIGNLVEEIQTQRINWVIVVDNGSTDDTGRLAKEAGAHVVREPRRGYGPKGGQGFPVLIKSFSKTKKRV